MEVQSKSETLPGSAFLAHALSAKLGNVTNISFGGANYENMVCFVTFWRQGKEAISARSSETLQILSFLNKNLDSQLVL